MFCSNCGKEIPDDSVKCPDCGRKSNGNSLKRTRKMHFPSWRNCTPAP